MQSLTAISHRSPKIVASNSRVRVTSRDEPIPDHLLSQSAPVPHPFAVFLANGWDTKKHNRPVHEEQPNSRVRVTSSDEPIPDHLLSQPAPVPHPFAVFLANGWDTKKHNRPVHGERSAAESKDLPGTPGLAFETWDSLELHPSCPVSGHGFSRAANAIKSMWPSQAAEKLSLAGGRRRRGFQPPHKASKIKQGFSPGILLFANCRLAPEFSRSLFSSGGRSSPISSGIQAISRSQFNPGTNPPGISWKIVYAASAAYSLLPNPDATDMPT